MLCTEHGAFSRHSFTRNGLYLIFAHLDTLWNSTSILSSDFGHKKKLVLQLERSTAYRDGAIN